MEQSVALQDEEKRVAARARPLTSSDLSWFSYDSYSPARLSRLPPQHWLQILDDRLFLERLVLSGDLEGALKLFEALKADPTASLGVSVKSILARHESDTPSVRLVRVKDVCVMTNVAERLQLDGSQCYDLVVPAEESDGLASRVHVSVNFEATKAQIRSDFNAWLNAVSRLRAKATNRHYGSVVREWGSQKYLPYFDLELYANASQARLPPSLMCQLLRVGAGRPSDMLKTPARSREAFTWETAEALRLHCGGPGQA